MREATSKDCKLCYRVRYNRYLVDPLQLLGAIFQSKVNENCNYFVVLGGTLPT